MRDRLLLILFVLIIGIFYCVDYKNDKVNIKEADLLKTIEDRGYIIVGVKGDTRPFGFIENGINKGFDIDLAKELAKYIFHDENKVKFVEVTPANRLFKLNSNEIDIIIATMTITQERRNIINFSTPYYVSKQAFLVNRSSNITSLSSLSGKNIGVLYGSTGEKDIRLLVPNANVKGYKTYKEAYKALKDKSISAIFTGDSLLKYFTLTDPSVKMLSKKYKKEYYAIAVRKNAASESLLNEINLNISSMNSDGSLLKLKRKWKLD